MAAAIKINGLTKEYGKTTAVNNLNLEIGYGEVFGLLGPNGAGKTTTILMLLGLTEPTKGIAQIAGHDCTRNPIQVKRMVGYLPDNVGFYGDMTGRENLRFIGRINGVTGKENEERIDALLERVGMTYAADQRVGTYSKGMKQRLGIADVLMKEPKIVILDEPTLGIDPEGVHELMILIKDLSVRDKRTVLISSHQLHQMQQICDRVGIFVKGSLIACGKIEELGKQVNKGVRRTLEFQAEPQDKALDELIKGIDGVDGFEVEKDFSLIHSTRDIRQDIIKQSMEKGYQIKQLRQRGGDLDDIYRMYFAREGAAQ